MNRRLATGALGPALVLAISVSVSAADESPPPAPQEPVYVDRAGLLYQGADPVQISLVVSGNLPTPCHQPDWSVSTGDDTVEVDLWSGQEGDGMCVAVLEPFQLVISLEEAVAGSSVTLNGEPVGEIVDPTDLGTVSGLAGAGTSFGMCAGTCVRDLSVDGAALVLRGYEHMLAEPVFTNRGEMTVDGQAAVEAAIADIEPGPLQSVYGCPDCADGGAAWVRLQRQGGVSEHVMEFGGPPAELARLYEVSMALMAPLESCQSSELVTVAADCQPHEGASASS